jgi:hypothetical protein
MHLYPSHVPIPEPQFWNIDWIELVHTNYHPGQARLSTPYGNGIDNEDPDTVTLLIPDRHRPNQEDFIWALPIERVKWNKWYELAKKLRTSVQGIRYLKRMENDKLQTILVMPNESQTDDDAMTGCAYLRMVDKVDCRIYVLRCKDDATLTGARLVDAVMGIDPDTLHEVDEDAINKEIEDHGNKA